MANLYNLIKSIAVLLVISLCLSVGLFDVQVVFADQPTITKGSSDKVLAPEKFVGKTALGYRAAQKIPEICKHLFCYCGCDLTDNHTNLLDCFTCEHGMDCEICQDEAIVALNLKEHGKSLSEIQKTIDSDFSYQYPWEKPSSVLIKYRQTYKLDDKTGGTVSGANISVRKRNKNGHSGKCCGHSKQ